MTFGYPDRPSPEEQQAAVNLFESLQYLLPCPKCSDHFCQGLAENPVGQHVQSKEALSRWLVDFHNRVNQRLGKKHVPYETVAQKYSASDSVCPVSAQAAAPAQAQAPVARIQHSRNKGNDGQMVAQIAVALVAILCVIGAGMLISKSVQK